MLLPLQTVGTRPRNHNVRVLARSGVEPSLANEDDGKCPNGYIFCGSENSANCCDPKYEDCFCDDKGRCFCVPNQTNFRLEQWITNANNSITVASRL
jgi:hypothetical protein